MSTLQIDVDQLRGPLSNEKATELGVVKTTELTALTTSLTELVDAKEQGYQLIGSVVVATDTPFDLSSTTAEVDGISIPEEGVAFFFGQTDLKENGAYQWNGTTWTRDPRFDEAAEIKLGNFFIVDQGTHAHDRVVITSTGSGRKKDHVIGTDDIVAEVKKRTLAMITPAVESGLTTKDAINTTDADGEPTGYTLQKDYDHITQIFIGVTPMLVGETTSAMAFFSADNGITAKLPGDFKVGDELFVDASKTKVAFPTGKLVQLTGLKGQHGQMGDKAGIRNNYAPTSASTEIPLQNPDGSPITSPKGKQVYQLHKSFTSPAEALINDVDEALEISHTITSLNQVFFIKADGLYTAAIRGGVEKQITIGNNITALEIDTQNRQLYWASESSGQIHKADLNGQNRVTIDTTGSVTVNDLVIAEGKLYQCLSGGVTVSELDGSGKTALVSGLSGQASGLAIDTASSTLFYADSVGHAIRKIGFDSSGASRLHASQFGARGIIKYQNKLYWMTLNSLASSDLDGANLTTLLTFADETTAGDLTVDSQREHLYFTRIGRIYRCNLDGSSLTLLNGKMDTTTASRLTSHLVYAHQETISPLMGEEEFGVMSTEAFQFMGMMTLRYSKKSDPVL
ncbi:MAG TPA: hypothetical protein DCS93_35730 [Microscillaceae bacterium]|nr:hypothetical protein [Microscillaceae bacterium]